MALLSFSPTACKSRKCKETRRPYLETTSILQLSLIRQLAQDTDGTILVGAQYLQASQSDLRIRTICLRDPNNPHSMDPQIVVPTSGDGGLDPGACK